jgi:RNA polymerase sigma-70 factor (family 1)
LFDQFFNPLAAFAFKYIQDQYVAEDMVQEVFVSLWGSKDNFDEIAAVKAFLYTSVRNKCLNHLKHEKVKRKHEETLVYQLESEQHFSAQVIEEETFDLLLAEIRILPAAAQEIMILAMNGMKNPEIADELGISINTVKTQKKISYAKLKDKLGPMMSFILLVLIA